MKLERSLPSADFIGASGLEIVGNVGHRSSSVVASVEQPIIGRCVQPAFDFGVKKGMKTIAIEHPCLEVGLDQCGAIVLRPYHQMACFAGVNRHGVALGDFEACGEVRHFFSLPQKHPAIVAQQHTPILKHRDAVLVGVRVFRLGCSLPVNGAVPCRSSIGGLPKIHAAHQDTVGLVRVNGNAQVPKRLSSTICTADRVAKKVRAIVSGGFRRPSEPAIHTAPKSQEILLKVVAGHCVHRVRGHAVRIGVSCQLNASNAVVGLGQLASLPIHAAVCGAVHPLVFDTHHRNAVIDPNQISRGPRAHEVERGSCIQGSEQTEIGSHKHRI